MPYGNVSYQGGMAGSGSPGGNPGNSLALLMQRLMGGQGGGATQYGSPDAELAMAKMLGLVKDGGMPPGSSMPGREMGGPPQMAGAMPPVPMSKPMMPAMAGGMGLGGGPDEETRRRLMLAMRGNGGGGGRM